MPVVAIASLLLTFLDLQWLLTFLSSQQLLDPLDPNPPQSKAVLEPPKKVGRKKTTKQPNTLTYLCKYVCLDILVFTMPKDFFWYYWYFGSFGYYAANFQYKIYIYIYMFVVVNFWYVTH